MVEQQISGSMRSRLRNKERKLAELQAYRYVRATSADEVDRLLSYFLQQKAGKLHALGIKNAFGAARRRRFHPGRLSRRGCEGGQPLIEIHALECDGEMLALFSGIHDSQRFTSMFNSHTASDNARQSPGLMLLQQLIADCARRGFSTFDIGPGEARYKTFFCKDARTHLRQHHRRCRARGKLAVHGLRAMRLDQGRDQAQSDIVAPCACAARQMGRAAKLPSEPLACLTRQRAAPPC